MARNFKILFQQKSENIHLELEGDFDGSSAWELINAMRSSSDKARRVFIHTDRLRHVDPFGKAVFENNFPETERRSGDFVIKGEKLVL
jgi:anti-anti-sigma regulatory factor